MNDRIYFDFQDDMTALHAELAAKHRWLVRKQDGSKPYYSDASLDDVIADVDADYAEVINNRWSREQYADVPYIYRLNEGYVFEEWRGHDEWGYGLREQGEEWYRLNYYDNTTQTSVNWCPMLYHFSIKHGALGVAIRDEGFRVTTYNGFFIRTLKRDSRGLCPHDIRQDFAIPAINEMRRQRLKGGYEPLVERIMAAFDVRPTEVKEAPTR